MSLTLLLVRKQLFMLNRVQCITLTDAYQGIDDHHSYTHNLTSCETKA